MSVEWVCKRVTDRSTTSSRRVVYLYRGPSETLGTFLASLGPGIKEINTVTDVSRVNGSYLHGFMDVEVVYETTDGSLPGTTFVPGTDGLVLLDYDMPWSGEDIDILEVDNTQALRTTASGGHPDWVSCIQEYVDKWKIKKQQALESDSDAPDWEPNTSENSGGAIPKNFTPTLAMKDLANDLAELLRDTPDIRVPISVPSIRKVQIVLATSTLKGSITNLNRVYTPAAVLAEEPAIEDFPYVDPDVLLGWYWVKQAPTLDRATGGLRQITQLFMGVKDYIPYIHKELITP